VPRTPRRRAAIRSPALSDDLISRAEAENVVDLAVSTLMGFLEAIPSSLPGALAGVTRGAFGYWLILDEASEE
jgi:ABC-type microcin C transport system permease subunit YejE